MNENIYIMITMEKNQLGRLCILLYSLCKADRDVLFHIYVIHSSLDKRDIEKLRNTADPRCRIYNIETNKIYMPGSGDSADCCCYNDFLLMSRILPGFLERILYLEPDVIAVNSVKEFYHMDFCGSCFIACGELADKQKGNSKNRPRTGKAEKNINKNVVLINLNQLRRELDSSDCISRPVSGQKDAAGFHLLNNSKAAKDRILLADCMKFNLSDHILQSYNSSLKNVRQKKDINWVRQNAVFIHYQRGEKPWKKDYEGILNELYTECFDELLLKSLC